MSNTHTYKVTTNSSDIAKTDVNRWPFALVAMAVWATLYRLVHAKSDTFLARQMSTPFL